jgi:hypothetical protein
MLISELKAVLLVGILICPIPLPATTVVLIVTRHGIILASDSKTFTINERYERSTESLTKKYVIVQDRIIVASIGHGDIRGGAHYNFLTWMNQLETGLPKDISVDDLASTIKTESAKVFMGFEDVFIKGGLLKPQDPSENLGSFIQYVIAGYQGGVPRICVVQFYVDWQQKRLIGPTMISRDLDERKGDFSVHAFGIKEAITDVLNRNSYAYSETMRSCPRTISKLTAHQDILIDETACLGYTLVDIEEKVNPSEVGGTIQLVEILPNGGAQELLDNNFTQGKGTAKKQTKTK